MKRILKLTTIVALTALVSFSCTKEKRIERRLSSRTGKWTIEMYKEQEYINGTLNDENTLVNYGTFVFDEDGNIIMTFTQDGDTYTSAGQWSNTKEEVTIIEDGYAYVLKIKESSRKEMTLENVEEYSDGSDNYKDVLTFELKKDK